MEIAEIPLSRGKVTLIDTADVDRVASYSWYASPNKRRWYAITTMDGRTVYLHRFLIGAPSGVEVDHENGDGLDNRRLNLRFSTHQLNMANQLLSAANTSGFKGVSYERGRAAWEAYVEVNQKKIRLGNFDDKETAALAYDLAALHHFGAFAKCNILSPDSDLENAAHRVKTGRRPPRWG